MLVRGEMDGNLRLREDGMKGKEICLRIDGCDGRGKEDMEEENGVRKEERE